MLPTSKKIVNPILLGKLSSKYFLLAWLLITFLIGHLLGMSLCQQIDVARIRNPELSCSSFPPKGRGIKITMTKGNRKAPPSPTPIKQQLTKREDSRGTIESVCRAASPSSHPKSTSWRWHYLKRRWRNTGQHFKAYFKNHSKTKGHNSATVFPVYLTKLHIHDFLEGENSASS